VQHLLYLVVLNWYCRIKMNDNINYLICPRCKTYTKETDLKDVYKCTGCGLIINERLDDRKEDGEVQR